MLHLRASPRRSSVAAPTKRAASSASGDASLVPDSAVPSALHRCLGYRGRSPPGTLSPAMQACMALIAETCSVPADFELDKIRFGPLSGVSHEDRLLRAFEMGLLPPKRAAAGDAAESGVAAPAAMRTAPSTPARAPVAGRGTATPLGSRTMPALDVTPARTDAAAGTAGPTAGAKRSRVLCAECGADGHWSYECPIRC